MTSISERRSFPRVPLSISINFKSGEHLLTASTSNISARGLCCTLSHHIPLFTKLSMCLMVPDPDDTCHEETDAINCEGVVVRVDKEIQDGHDVFMTAVFFTQIGADAVAQLLHYIKANVES